MWMLAYRHRMVSSSCCLLPLLLLPRQHVEGFHLSRFLARCPHRQVSMTTIPRPVVDRPILLHGSIFPKSTNILPSPSKTPSHAHSHSFSSSSSTSINVKPSRAASTGQAHAHHPYIELLRPHNVLPSMCLVLVGAWITARDLRRVIDPVVVMMGKCRA